MASTSVSMKSLNTVANRTFISASTGARSRDFTLELDEEEQPKRREFFQWIWNSMSPFPPPGLRHNALPSTGVMASNRLNTLTRCMDQIKSGQALASDSGKGQAQDRLVRRANTRLSRRKVHPEEDDITLQNCENGQSDFVVRSGIV